jgi:hypothetical protein
LLRGPQVVAMGALSESVGTGERVALVATIVWVFDRENNPKGATVSQVTELRFVGGDSAGISLESRSGKPTPDFDRCVEGRLATALHFPDWRYHAVAGCTQGARWEAWRSLRFSSNGAYDLSGLPLTFKVRNGRLSVAVEAM